MSDFPFSIPRRGDADVVNGVSYAGTTLTLTRSEGSDLTTTIAAGDPTKIENGTSKMEIATSNGDCVFTPNGDAALTTTFAADGNVGIGTTTPVANINAVVATAPTFATMAEFRSGNYGNDNDKATAVNIRASGENSDCVIQFGTPHSTAGSAASPSTGYKCALVAEGMNSYSRSKFHVCLEPDLTQTYNAYNPAISNSKFSVDYDGNVTVTGTVSASNGSPLSSDDRIKENEKLIVNATETLSKLTPQIYDKYLNMDLSGSFQIESGLIAQEVYYNAPELRHLVVVGKDYDTSGNEYTPTPEEMDLSGVDIANDPDYGSHGWSKTEHSWLNYQGLIPYLIKSNQEMAERLAALENK